MNSQTITKFAIYLAFIWFGPCFCFEFDQNYLGVELTPHVKKYSDKSANSYTYSDMKTQLTLVSEMFSNILIRDALVHEDYYLPNFTYYLGSYASAFAGEIAACMNKENGSKKITISYSLMERSTVEKTRWDISVAFEAAEKANDIFPDTVKRISLCQHDDLQRTLSHLHTYRSNAFALGIKLGAAINCFQLQKRTNETWDRTIREIVGAADFIICYSEVISPTRGPEILWPSIDTDFMSFKHTIGQINSGVEVIATTMWSSSELSKVQTVQDLKLYWELANKFAAENQYRIYLSEAFDNPNRGPDRSKHRGWWKLTPGSKTDSINGYMEKITDLEPRTPLPTTPSPAENEDNITTASSEFCGEPNPTPNNVCCFKGILSTDYMNKYFGVSIDPNIDTRNQPRPEITYYLIQKFVAMLTIVSQQFSNVLVETQATYHDHFVYNYTYYHGGWANLYQGNAAALVNKRNGSKLLTLLYNVMYTADNFYKPAAISLAIEAAQKANAIFPGTVEGIVFGIHPRVPLDTIEQYLYYLRSYKERAAKLGLKLGTRQDCNTFFSHKNESIQNLQNQILTESDVTLCQFQIQSYEEKDPSSVATKLGNTLRSYSFKHTKKRATKDSKLVFAVKLTSMEANYDNVEMVRSHWREFSKLTWIRFADTRIYMLHSFDDPDNTDPGYQTDICCSGIWRVMRNPLTLTEQYEEKFSGTIFTPEKPFKRWEPITSASTQLAESNYVPLPNGNKMFSTTTTAPTIESGAVPTIETVTEPNMVLVKVNKNSSKDNLTLTGWTNETVIIVISSIAGTTVVLALLFVIILQVYRTKQLIVLNVNEIRAFKFGTSKNPTPHDPVVVMPSTAVNAPYDTSLEISKHNIKIDTSHILGSGQFGCVFKATIKLEGNEKIAVALKVAKNNCQPTALKGLLSEIKVMAYLGKHSNIVAIKGAYTAEMARGVVYVATELCSLGSLQGFLRKKQTIERDITARSDANVEEIELCEDSVISMEDMVRWSYEIACGMEHLERKYVVHADLATRNVLLTSDKTAKIADFGLSRRMYNYLDYVKTQQEPLPWRWMAIESLRKMEFSSKSDVWSYAITLWEIFSNGDTPYPGLSWTNDFVDQLINGLRPNSPSHAFSEIYGIMKCCWQVEPNERPCFSELTGLLYDFLGRRITRGSEEASTYLELEEM